MTDYLLDTNHASRLMSGDGTLVRSIRAARTAGDRFGVSITVVAELYFAVYASRRQDENRHRLDDLVTSLVVWPFDASAAEEFGRIQAEQKARGRPIPALDAQIAAVARSRDLKLLTADRHFDYVAGVIAENWLH